MLLSSFTGNLLEAGCDEAGRGCLAGPVVAAAVILPKDFSHPAIDDSKKLSHTKRVELRKVIEKEAIAWAIGEVWNREIDEINILNASFLAMHKAISRLVTKPEFLLIDGNRFKPFHGIAHECIIKGDGKYFAIASASIIAKTHRDQLMTTLAMKYPQYKWDSNKGYPTLEHREQIREFGITEYHRQSFRLLPDQLGLFD